MADGPVSSGRLLAAVLLVLTALSSAAGYCSQGSDWVEYNGNCYHWSRPHELQNWFRSELNCVSSGAHLVSIATQSESNFLLRLTQCSSPFWIGMVNTVHSLKGQVGGYEWWDGTSRNYTNLQGLSIINNYYDCILSYSNGVWNPNHCQNSLTYVCKAPATALQGSPDEMSPPKQQKVDAVWHTTREEQATSTTMWPTPTPAPAKCPSGWQMIDRSCYFVSDNRTNYFNAQMSCQAFGASVASVLTPREHTLLTVALGCHSPVWIGLEKARPCFMQPNKDHCWVWMDRSPVNYFGWASGQTLDRRDAECVLLDGQWKVTNCYAEYRYICKQAAFSSGKSD